MTKVAVFKPICKYCGTLDTEWSDYHTASTLGLNHYKEKHGKEIEPSFSILLLPQLYKDRNWLTMNYWGFDKTLKEMAEESSSTVDLILDWMKKYDIPRDYQRCGKRTSEIVNKRYEGELYRNKEFLTKLYIEKKYTVEQIAKICQCSTACCAMWMSKLGVPTRNAKERNEIWKYNQKMKRWCGEVDCFNHIYKKKLIKMLSQSSPE